MMNAGASEKSAPFSVRLTAAERRRLESAAGGLPLGSYIRSRLLDDGAPVRRARGYRPLQDHEALGRLLGALGSSRLASNLNQLAKAVNTGSLPVTPDTEAAIRDACAEIRQIRIELLRALGLNVPEDR